MNVETFTKVSQSELTRRRRANTLVYLISITSVVDDHFVTAFDRSRSTRFRLELLPNSGENGNVKRTIGVRATNVAYIPESPFSLELG
jgi:hypothetical protein